MNIPIMRPNPPDSGDTSGDDSCALIVTLHDIQRRLHECMNGGAQAGAALDDGQFVQRYSQGRLSLGQATRQAGVRNALPAQIALLDGDGFIIPVNEEVAKSRKGQRPPESSIVTEEIPPARTRRANGDLPEQAPRRPAGTAARKEFA